MQFLGKRIQYLPECHSTNGILSKMIAHDDIEEGFVITTDHQSKGKGQRGNIWISEKGKNLLFSVLLKPVFLKASEGFLLNLVTGLAVRQALLDLLPQEEVLLKWPNDVYINGKKISGILIETDLTNSTLENAIVGIGFNVNQSHFSLSNATSLLIETSLTFETSEVLSTILGALEKYYLLLKTEKKGRILQEYHQSMLWKGERHTYESLGSTFEGVLLGVDEVGNLVLDCDGVKKSYRTKEITFVG